MASNLVNYKDFEIDKLVIGKVVGKKSIKDPSAAYSEMPIKYRYPNGQIDDLCIEFPEVTSIGGIVTKLDEKTGKLQSSINGIFDISNPDIENFVNKGSFLEEEAQGTCGKIYFKCLQALFEQKGTLSGNFAKQQKIDTLEVLFGDFIFWPLDETGTPIKGKNPSKFLNLLNIETKNGGKIQTLFNSPIIDPKTKKFQKIPWEYLQNVKMKFIPNVKISKIYIGAKASIQSKLESAIITEINKIGDVSAQTETLNYYVSHRPDIVAAVEQSLMSIMNLSNSAKAEESVINEETQVVVNNEGEFDTTNLPGMRKI